MTATDPTQSVPVESKGAAESPTSGQGRESDLAGSIACQRHRLVQLACRFVWSRNDAEDAVHNALTLARQKGHQLRDAGKSWSWLCRIVVRQCLLLHRHDRRRAEHQEALAAHRRSTPGADDGLEQGERADLVRWAVERLPPQQRIALTLRVLDEMSYQEIADIMEITPGTVRVHVRAARQAMRQAILRRDPDFGRSSVTPKGDRP